MNYKEQLETILNRLNTSQKPFFFVDLNAISRKLNHWRTVFPNIQPFYAVKCNPDPTILSEMAKLGLNFDCASRSEISDVLNTSVSPDRIIFANPHKPAEDIQYAIHNKIFKMTFDSLEELSKISILFQSKPILSEIHLFLRIKVRNLKAFSNLNAKYGADSSAFRSIIERIEKNKMNLKGISFHVGSLCYDVNAYERGLKKAKRVMEMACERKLDSVSVIDIGGGYMGGIHGGFYESGSDKSGIDCFGGEDRCDIVNLEEIGVVFDDISKKLFDSDVKFIAEPGRFFVESCQTLVSHIIARNIIKKETISSPEEKHNLIDRVEYHLNQGIYDTFKDAYLMNCDFIPHILTTKKDSLHNTSKFQSVLRGPSNDPSDLINKDCSLPLLEIGDALYFISMGAYTSSIRSSAMKRIDFDFHYGRIG